MSVIKQYFKSEIQWCMLGLEHPKPSDFYLSVWQTTRSSVPLLIFRTLLFLTSLGIVLSSMILYILDGIYRFWFIYLTHWGLLSIVFVTGFATAVSVRCYWYGPLSADVSLPWYVKTYWVLHNVANPIAYLITAFYWTVLYEAGFNEELNFGLDVAVHALNTVIVILLLFSSSQPSRLLHMYQPFCFALVYVFFSIVYYFAGGVNPAGNRWIYPVINWAQPGPTVGVAAITGLLLFFTHLMAVSMALARDAISTRLIKPSVTVHVDEGMPLRQPR